LAGTDGVGLTQGDIDRGCRFPQARPNQPSSRSLAIGSRRTARCAGRQRVQMRCYTSAWPISTVNWPMH
jgi:hypothetical protein